MLTFWAAVITVHTQNMMTFTLLPFQVFVEAMASHAFAIALTAVKAHRPCVLVVS